MKLGSYIIGLIYALFSLNSNIEDFVMNKVRIGVLSLLAFTAPIALAGNSAPPQTPIPEPSMLPLFILGGLAIYFFKKKK